LEQRFGVGGRNALVDAHGADLVPNLDLLAGLANICRRLYGVEQGFLPVGAFAIGPLFKEHDPALWHSLSADPKEHC